MPNKFFKIQAKAAHGEVKASAEIFIYSPIGSSWWDETVAAKDFIQELNALDVDEITIRISSIGGSVPDGIAIYNAIKRHKATITTCNDGVAYSIASLILMAGDKVEMAENAHFMIHAPWTYADGNAQQLRDIADMLDSWSQAMASSYANKTGKSKEEILTLLTDGKDHFFTAEEAKAEGFVDTITNGLAIAASLDREGLLKNMRQDFVSAPLAPTAVAAATPQHQEIIMPAPTPAAAEPTAKETADIQARAASEALAADKTRRTEIRAAFSKFSTTEGVAAIQQECEDDINCSVEAANAKLLAHLGSKTEPIAGRIVTIQDASDKMRAGISAALQMRSGLIVIDSSNPYRGYTLLEMARASLERAGFRTEGMDKLKVVGAAFTHGTSDFTNLLADIANKSMLKGYEEAEETFQRWTSVGNLPDFKPTKRVDLNTFPALAEVAEGAEYTYATVGDRGETTQLATYGKMFSITRQAIINDDLDAFTKIPRNMGRASVRTVGNLVYAVLTGNPLMSDGVALFDNAHNNQPTSAAISTESVDAMMAAIRKQKDGSNNTLNIRMAYLLAPVALEGKAMTVANSEFEVGASSKNNTTPNYVRGRFEVISDARLDVASTAVWYGAANPGMHDTIEVSYLDGNAMPRLEEQAGWSVDGVEMKVSLDAAVKALDFRTLAKNAGG